MRKFIMILFLTIVLGCCIGCVSIKVNDTEHNEIEENEIVFIDSVERSSIKVELIIDSFSLKNKEFKVSLKATNLIDKDIALENAFLYRFDSGETNGTIVVKNEKGEEIDYLGRLVSMLVDYPPKLEKCTILKAGETIIVNKSPNLYDNYDFDGLYSDVTFKELNFYYFGYLGKSQVVTIADFD